MNTEPSALAIVALAWSIVSIVLAGVAYWRAGGGQDIEAVAVRQRLVLDELSRRTQSGLVDALAHVIRAEQRLAELRREAPKGLRPALDALSCELSDVEIEAEQGLQQVRAQVAALARSRSSDTRAADLPVPGPAVQVALAKRIRLIEGSIHILTARAEIGIVEKLLDAGQFVQAEDVLDDALAETRAVKMRLADEVGNAPAFAPLLRALHEAIHKVRAHAADHKRDIETALVASDSLLATLHPRGYAA